MAYIYMMLIRRTIAPSKENKRSQIGYNPLAEGFHLERPMTTIISYYLQFLDIPNDYFVSFECQFSNLNRRVL